MKIFLILLALVVLVYALFGFYLYRFQRKLIYFPTAAFEHPYTVESLLVDGVALEVVVLNPGRSRAVIYFGGNAEPVTLSAKEIEHLLPTQTIYLLSYRGYGNSGGQPSEKGIYQDALALMSQVSARHTSISVAGRSLGTGVALYLAAHSPVERLVLITPYDSIAALARQQFPIYPVDLLLQDRFDAVAFAAAIDIPVLALVAEHDQIIPAKNTQRLLDAMDSQRLRVLRLAGTDHVNISQHPDYYPQISAFLSAE